MNRFYKRKEIQKLAADHGLDGETQTRHRPELINAFYVSDSEMWA